MNGFNILKDILLRLTKKEISALKSYLRSNRLGAQEETIKTLQLLKLIIDDTHYSSKRIQNEIYGRENYLAFNKLTNRLKESIYEVLIWDINLKDSRTYQLRNQVYFELKKRLIKCEILYLRGITIELEKQFEYVISESKKFDLYDCVLEGLNLKRRFIGFRFKSEIYEELKNEIEFYEKCRVKTIEARYIYNNIVSKPDFKNSIAYLDELELAINVLKADFIITDSAYIGFYYFLILAEYHQNSFQYLKARNTLMILKQLVESRPALFTKYTIGHVTANLLNNELFLYNFDKALIYLDAAKKYLSNTKANAEILLELEFLIAFYSNNLDSSLKIIENLYYTSSKTELLFYLNKRIFYLATIKSLFDDFNQSNALLKEIKRFDKRKEGWNLGVRLLTIINFIELEKYDVADLRIASMQKHISRIIVKQNVSKRNLVILRMLLLLRRHGYDFKKTLKAGHRIMSQLESNDREYRWQIKSPEMIIFHEWFRSKAELRRYDMTGAIKKEKEKFLKASR
jgi:hypothetical protein